MYICRKKNDLFLTVFHRIEQDLNTICSLVLRVSDLVVCGENISRNNLNRPLVRTVVSGRLSKYHKMNTMNVVQ